MRVCVNCGHVRQEGSFYSNGRHPADVCKPCVHRPRRANVIASVKDRQRRNRTAIAKFVQQLQHRKESLVYLAKAGKRVKIGYASNVLARLRTLETGAGCPVQLLAVVPGGRQLESALHDQFEAARDYHEWFRFSDEILLEFAKLPGSMVLLKGFFKQDAPLVA